LISQWCAQWRLLLKPSKSSTTVFSTNSRLNLKNLPPLRLLSADIPFQKYPRFLGLHLDPRLTFGHHFDKTLTSCKRKLNLLRRLLSTPWRHHRPALLTIYKGFIRPTLEYCSILYHSASASQLLRLDRLQARALRVITGATISTPHLLLESETMTSSLLSRRQTALLHALHRVQALPPDSPLSTRLQSWNVFKLPDRSFFDSAYITHQSLLNLPTDATQPNPFPPFLAPWLQEPPRPLPVNFISETRTFRLRIRKSIRQSQQDLYSSSSRADHYRQFRQNLTEPWFSSQISDYHLSKVIFRLRAGHSKLAAHDRSSPTDLCLCLQPQTVSHILLDCPLFSSDRVLLFNSVKNTLQTNSSPTLTTLLGNPHKASSDQLLRILSLTSTFLTSTNLQI
jgi:hypothetical protein